MNKANPTNTYQTRIVVDQQQHWVLLQYAALLSKVVRTLFAFVMAGRNLLSEKSQCMKMFGISARQYNACRVEIEGKIASIRELNNQRIVSLRKAILDAEVRIKKLETKERFRCRLWFQKRRKMRLQAKLIRLEQDKAAGRVRLCFGSRKLFRSQFSNDETGNGDWKLQWQQRRDREFFALGSKDESSGNQTCTATVNDDLSITLRLRLPDALNQGKHLLLENLRFKYGHEVILAALESCKLRKKLKKEGCSSYTDHGQAISYRFLMDDKGWRVFVSTALPVTNITTDPRLGAIGVDINSDHLAIVETDRNGNPIYYESVPCSLYGKSQDQTKAIIGDACARVVSLAKASGKPLVVEKLDFQRKRAGLKGANKSYARMLSSFAYQSILQILSSRAYRNGVEICSVNPAFTSLLGRIKFSTRYGLSIHHAAALSIARRYYGFSESLPLQSLVPDGKGCHITFSVPARNQKDNGWQYLKKVARRLQVALAEHFRAVLNRSTLLQNVASCDDHSSRIVGEIPARESLAELLG